MKTSCLINCSCVAINASRSSFNSIPSLTFPECSQHLFENILKTADWNLNNRFLSFSCQQLLKSL